MVYLLFFQRPKFCKEIIYSETIEEQNSINLSCQTCIVYSFLEAQSQQHQSAALQNRDSHNANVLVWPYSWNRSVL
jgi:hypothetical protein